MTCCLIFYGEKSADAAGETDFFPVRRAIRFILPWRILPCHFVYAPWASADSREMLMIDARPAYMALPRLSALVTKCSNREAQRRDAICCTEAHVRLRGGGYRGGRRRGAESACCHMTRCAANVTPPHYAAAFAAGSGQCAIAVRVSSYETSVAATRRT